MLLVSRIIGCLFFIWSCEMFRFILILICCCWVCVWCKWLSVCIVYELVFEVLMCSLICLVCDGWLVIEKVCLFFLFNISCIYWFVLNDIGCCGFKMILCMWFVSGLIVIMLVSNVCIVYFYKYRSKFGYELYL